MRIITLLIISIFPVSSLALSLVNPCNEKANFWVSFDWAGIEMHEYYKNSMNEPYQPMYIEFRGQILDEVVDGFAESSDGLIRISEVTEYSFRVPDTCN